MKYYAYGCCDIGVTRPNNEDGFLINGTVSNESFGTITEQPLICAVCDGVAGEASGEIASGMVLEFLSKLTPKKPSELKMDILEAHERLKIYGENNPRCENMQTTLCCLVIDEDNYPYCINVGDSRMYLYSGGEILQVSTDQSLVQFLYDTGKISSEEKAVHTDRNVIFPVLGNVLTTPRIDITPLGKTLSEGDIIIICSDGVSDYLTAEELEIGLSIELDFSERIDTLIELAIERGSSDNLTIVGIMPIG